MLTIETLTDAQMARVAPVLLTALIERVVLLARGWPDADLRIGPTGCGIAVTVAVDDLPVAGEFLPFTVEPCVAPAVSA